MPPDTPQPAASLRVVIVDDEELARLRLRALLADCVAPAAQVVADFGSATAALQWLGHQRCDVVLLDIRMPGVDGLQMAERLRAMPRAPAVVFVTAHAEHALAAFDVQAIDYLTKPVRRARLQEALARVAQRLSVDAAANGHGTPREGSELARANTVPAGLADAALARAAEDPPSGRLPPARAAGPSSPDEPFILVPERGGFMRVPQAQVLYLKAELKYVTMRTATASYLIEASLIELEPRLGERFLRIHRNAIVARRAVRALQRRSLGGAQAALDPVDAADSWAVCVEPAGEWLAVSRRQLATVREALAADGLG